MTDFLNTIVEILLRTTLVKQIQIILGIAVAPNSIAHCSVSCPTQACTCSNHWMSAFLTLSSSSWRKVLLECKLRSQKTYCTLLKTMLQAQIATALDGITNVTATILSSFKICDIISVAVICQKLCLINNNAFSFMQ